MYTAEFGSPICPCVIPNGPIEVSEPFSQDGSRVSMGWFQGGLLNSRGEGNKNAGAQDSAVAEVAPRAALERPLAAALLQHTLLSNERRPRSLHMMTSSPVTHLNITSSSDHLTL